MEAVDKCGWLRFFTPLSLSVSRIARRGGCAPSSSPRYDVTLAAGVPKQRYTQHGVPRPEIDRVCPSQRLQPFPPSGLIIILVILYGGGSQITSFFFFSLAKGGRTNVDDYEYYQQYLCTRLE